MEEITSNTFGMLSSASDNAIINAVYNYVSSILADFKGRNDENENAITNRLCKRLEYKKPSEYPFYFHHQNVEDDKENTSTDFAVFGTYAYALENDLEEEKSPSLVKFEAKRLNSSLPAKREREYVCGEYAEGKCVTNSGGIERFKNGRHGKDVINAGIIGYIQTDSPEHWLKKINGWIQEQIKSPSDTRLTWSKNDTLQLNNQAGNLSAYSSSSSRISGDEIRFRHFWVNTLDVSK